MLKSTPLWKNWSIHEKKKLRDRLLTETLKRNTNQSDFSIYADDPIRYAKEILNVEWWSMQKEIARAVSEHKYVFIKASHSIGKSHIAGGLVNWWYDTFNPSICLTTAPTAQHVIDVLWKEVRIQRGGRPGLYPKAPRLQDSPNHFATGLTSNEDSAFQGKHEERVLIIFDECVGIDKQIWTAAEGMMTTPQSRLVVICNPTDTSTHAYDESLKTDKWRVIEISALDHPNISADINSLPVPFPSAVRLDWITGRIDDWCERIPTDDRTRIDFEFPPGTNKWYKPGPLFESRVLGRWPSQATNSIWTDTAWSTMLTRQTHDPGTHIIISCDVARFGDDNTTIFSRQGNCILHYETHNGWSTSQTAGSLTRLASHYHDLYPDAEITINIDDGGVGGGVVDQATAHKFTPCLGANRAHEADNYPNRRSELWFVTHDRALDERIDISRLTPDTQNSLRRQLYAPTWRMDAQGRRTVEPKDQTKRRLHRSPDDADAFNLLFAAEQKLISNTKQYRDFWHNESEE